MDVSRELDAMKRLESEDQIPLKQAGPLFRWRPCRRALQNYPTKGRRVHLADERVYLEAYRSVLGWITSKQAVERFIKKLNGGDLDE